MNRGDLPVPETAIVRAELCARIDVLAGLDRTRLAGEVDSLRRLARAHGIGPVASVAEALKTAVARGARGPAVAAWVEVRDAAACERLDDQAGEAFAAFGARRIGA